MGGGGKPCDMQQACGQSNQQVLSSSKTKVHPVSVSEAAITLKLLLLYFLWLLVIFFLILVILNLFFLINH